MPLYSCNVGLNDGLIYMGFEENDGVNKFSFFYLLPWACLI